LHRSRAVVFVANFLIVGLHNPIFSGDQELELKDAYLSVQRLKRLIEDLTKYAQDVRFGRLNPEVFTLSVLHTQAQFDFQSQFQKRDIVFTCELSPDSCGNWQIYGDYYRLSQVLNNMIQNAIKYTKPGGRIATRIKALGKPRPKLGTDRESAHSSGGMVPGQDSRESSSSSGDRKEGPDWHVEYFEFEVEDNGIGIAKEDLTKIFEPWHQLADSKTSQTEEYRGVGLGLAICHFWVAQMDGQIEVISRRAPSVNERGRTVFKFSLPLRVERVLRRVSGDGKLSETGSRSDALLASNIADSELPAADVQEVKTAAISYPPATFPFASKLDFHILIAEDEPINQRVVHRMLIKDGFRHISFAQNGFEAIEAVSRAQAQGERLDLILMDFQMPYVDGPLAATVIRRMPHIAQDRLTIVALTAYDDEKSKQDCLSAGMNDFLTKPIRYSVLSETLTRHLSLPTVPEDED
jgi:CheY-like chemotaxis protein